MPFRGRPLKLNNFIEMCVTKGYKGFTAHGDGIMEIWAPRHGPDFDPAYEQIHKDYEAYNGRPYKGYTKSNLSLKAAIKKSSCFEVLSSKNCRFIFREKSKKEVDALKRARKAALRKLIEKKTIDDPPPQNVPLTLNLKENLLEAQRQQLENKVYVKLEQFDIETEPAPSIDSMEEEFNNGSEEFNNGSKSNVEIKTENIQDTNEVTSDFQEKIKPSLPQQTSLQLERTESDPPTAYFPSVSQKIIDRPGPRCKKPLGANLMEKKVPDRPILPKQTETCLVPSTVPCVLDPRILFSPQTSENVIGKPVGQPSFLLIVTSQQGSSNVQKKQFENLSRVEELDNSLTVNTKKSESPNPIIVSQQRKTNSPLVSSLHQESQPFIEKKLENAPLVIDLESEDSSKSIETEFSKPESTSQHKIINLPLISNSFQSCSDVQELRCETVPPPVDIELQRASQKRKKEASKLELALSSEFKQSTVPLVSSSYLQSTKLMDQPCKVVSQPVHEESNSSSNILKADATKLNPVPGCSPTNSLFVSSSLQPCPKLPEKQDNTISHQIHLESGNFKRRRTDSNLADVNQDCSLQLKNKFFENNLKFDESLIELAKKQILTEIAKNPHAESDDLLFLRSLMPYISKIPDSLKLRFRSRIQEVVEEFVTMQPRVPI